MTAIYDQSRGQYVQSPNANVSAPAGLMRAGSTFVRAPVRSTADRTAQIGSSGSPLMQMAEKGAMRGFARAGLQNSSLALQAGQNAAIQQAGQFALADAQLQAAADAQNADSLNAVQIAELQRQAATASSNSASTGAQYNQLDSQIDHDRRIALMREQSRLNREEAGDDRSWRSGESQRDRDWRGGQSDLDRGMQREGWDREYGDRGADRDWRSRESQRDRDAARADARETRAWQRENMTLEQRYSSFQSMMQMMGTTLFSDPSFWRDQDGASGFLQFFSQQFGGLFDRYFSNRGTAPAPGGG